MQRYGTVLALGALVALTLLALAGQSRISGPVLVGRGSHGVHLEDLGTLTIAALGLLGLALSRRR